MATRIISKNKNRIEIETTADACEIKPSNCSLCGKEAVCAIITFSNTDTHFMFYIDKSWVYIENPNQKIIYYCEEHDPASR